MTKKIPQYGNVWHMSVRRVRDPVFRAQLGYTKVQRIHSFLELYNIDLNGIS